MTPRPATAIQAAKLTTQLSRGDLITIDGLGAFAVIRARTLRLPGPHPARLGQPRRHRPPRHHLDRHQSRHRPVRARLPALPGL